MDIMHIIRYKVLYLWNKSTVNKDEQYFYACFQHEKKTKLLAIKTFIKYQKLFKRKSNSSNRSRDQPNKTCKLKDTILKLIMMNDYNTMSIYCRTLNS